MKIGKSIDCSQHSCMLLVAGISSTVTVLKFFYQSVTLGVPVRHSEFLDYSRNSPQLGVLGFRLNTLGLPVAQRECIDSS